MEAEGAAVGLVVAVAARRPTRAARRHSCARSRSDKPSDAVYAIVAWWFSQYGSAPITRENIEALATQIGVTLPNRPDSTLAKAKKDGRALFRAVTRGAYAPTVPHGEVFLKKEYKVQKGTKTPPTAND